MKRGSGSQEDGCGAATVQTVEVPLKPFLTLKRPKRGAAPQWPPSKKPASTPRPKWTHHRSKSPSGHDNDAVPLTTETVVLNSSPCGEAKEAQAKSPLGTKEHDMPKETLESIGRAMEGWTWPSSPPLPPTGEASLDVKPDIKSVEEMVQAIQEAQKVIAKELENVTETFRSTETFKKTLFETTQRAKVKMDQRDQALNTVKEKKVSGVQFLLNFK